MIKVLVNRKMVRKDNKNMKAARKESLKMYGKAPKAVIKNKMGKFTKCTTEILRTASDVKSVEVSQQEFLEKIKEVHLAGLSGGNFPVIEKVKAFLDSDAAHKQILINGAECDPFLVHDQWLVDSKFAEILSGVQIVRKALGVKRVTVAAKDFPETYNLKDMDGVDLYKLPVRYPMGEEHVLIRQTLGIEVPAVQIPAKMGILVMNLQTVYAIYRLFSGEVLDGRYVTIANLELAQAQAVYVTYGEKIKEKVIEFYGNCGKIYAGGALAGYEVDDDMVFSPEVSFAGTASKIALNTNQNKCKGCGACQKVCPQGVQVKKIVKLREKDRNADVSGLGLEKCIHCNSCTFECRGEKNIYEYLQ